MAGPISLHGQDYVPANSSSPLDPANIGPVVFNVTTDEDTHSVLLSAVVSVASAAGDGADSVQFYRVGISSGDNFNSLGDPVGPAYVFSSMDGSLTPPTLVLVVDPDPPETGAYVLGLLAVDGVLTFTAASMTAFTF